MKRHIQILLPMLFTLLTFYIGISSDRILAQVAIKDKVQLEEKKTFVSFSFLGLLPFLQAGANYGYYLTENNTLDYGFRFNSHATSDLRSLEGSIGLKTLWWRSVFTSVGLGVSELRYSKTFYPLESAQAPQVRQIDVKENTLNLDISIGNQWNSSDGFIWGFDWLTFGLPLQRIRKAQFSAEIVDEQTESGAYINKTKHDDPLAVGGLGRFYLGKRF